MPTNTNSAASRTCGNVAAVRRPANDHFQKAVRAQERYADRHGLVSATPSVRLSAIEDGEIVLRNVRGELARYRVTKRGGVRRVERAESGATQIAGVAIDLKPNKDTRNTPGRGAPDYDAGRALFSIAIARDIDAEGDHIDPSSPLIDAIIASDDSGETEWSLAYLNAILNSVEPGLSPRAHGAPATWAIYYAALRSMCSLERTGTGRVRSIQWDNRLVRAVAGALTDAGGVAPLRDDYYRDDVPVGPVVADFLSGFAHRLGVTMRLAADFSSPTGTSFIGEAAES